MDVEGQATHPPSILELRELAELGAGEHMDAAQVEHDLKTMRQREKQLANLLKKVDDEIWNKSVEGYMDTVSNPENLGLAQKREAICAQLEERTRAIRATEQTVAKAADRRQDEYRRLESIQKLVANHFNAIDSAAKLTAGGNEVKMINRFINYCKDQVEATHRRDVVVKLLALCMKDDARKDNFLTTLAEQPEFEKEKGNLEWVHTHFINIMRGSDWLGSQFSAMINI
jgi:hypothetical protein